MCIRDSQQNTAAAFCAVYHLTHHAATTAWAEVRHPCHLPPVRTYKSEEDVDAFTIIILTAG
eukprot:3581303-Pyramimonas_sp.AAC.1